MMDQQLMLHEWKSVKRKKTRKNNLSDQKVYVRYKPLKSGHKMYVYIGNQILARLHWQIGDRVELLNHESRHTQFVIIPDLRGSTISQGRRSNFGYITLVTDKRYPFEDDESIAVRFTEYHNYLMFDISKPEIQGFNRI